MVAVVAVVDRRLILIPLRPTAVEKVAASVGEPIEEFIQLPSRDSLGTINLNRSVFSTIATNVIDETENVQLFEGSKPFKGGVQTRIEDNQLWLTVPVRIQYNTNVTDICASLQNQIFESISYMTDYKPESIEIEVVGFLF